MDNMSLIFDSKNNPVQRGLIKDTNNFVLVSTCTYSEVIIIM